MTSAALVGMALAALAAPPAGARLEGDFPQARVTRSPGGQVVQASGFEAAGLAGGPAEAATAFLRKYGSDFGVGARQSLRVLEVAPGGTRARVGRAVDGLPVFAADLVVGFTPGGAVTSVSARPVPAQPGGRFRLGRKAAVRAARSALEEDTTFTSSPSTAKGWYPAGDSLRAAWQVDLTARSPAGQWRIYVDAESGAILFRTDRHRSRGRRKAGRGRRSCRGERRRDW